MEKKIKGKFGLWALVIFLLVGMSTIALADNTGNK